MRGRKPLPEKLKVLKGTDRPSRANPDAPEAGTDGLQFIPNELSEAARPYWSQIRTKLVKAGIANDLDREALIMLCENWATLLEATDGLRKHGIVVKGRHGYPVKSPYLTVINQAQERVAKLLVEFGMTASARTRIQVPKEPEASDGFDID